MSDTRASSRETILIIDDNRINMELVTVLLRAEGYGILQAEDAETGIALARDEKPLLILMDLSLPGMDGLSATEILKREAETKDIPVVALTGLARKGDEERALAAGCVGYMAKPINTRTFPGQIDHFIRMARQST
jgi:two-component system, cell cycle response regulator DivK